MQGNVKETKSVNGEQQLFFGSLLFFSQGKDLSESEDNAAHMQLRSL